MRMLAVLLIALVPATVLAQNVGQCGWGSKLFSGQSGIAPQVLAVTTNGTSGNQTFAITSGTSGCTQNGVVRSSWKTAAFLDNNMNRFAQDVSRGEGETLASLASLLQVEEAHTVLFNRTLKNSFSKLFAHHQTTTTEVMAGLKEVLAAEAELAAYAANI